MKKMTTFGALFLAAMLAVSCGETPVSPSPNPSPTPSPTPTPSDPAICQDPNAKNYGQVGVCDFTYLSPAGVLPTMLGRVPVKEGAFKVTVLRINPSPGSVLQNNKDVLIMMHHEVIDDTPNPDGNGYTPEYDLVDEQGNNLTNWLGGGSSTFQPGTSGDQPWATRVDPAANIPSNIYGLRIRWGRGVSGGGGYVLFPNIEGAGTPISVVIPLHWKH